MSDGTDRKPALDSARTRIGAAAGASPAPATRSPVALPRTAFAKRDLHWTETVGGKLAIRAFSRGIVAGAFFSWGARLTGQQLADYNPGDPAHPLNGYNPKKPLQFIAHQVDKFVGKPIEVLGDLAMGNGKSWVTFRPTRSYGMTTDGDGNIVRNHGRTLGSELTSITFDFAMASVGNGIGDEIMLGLFNPKARAKWTKDGKFHFPHALKHLCGRVWHIVSYRAGEDVAVALPYAFFLRAVRNVLDKIDPGFGYDSDRALNGGSIKVDDFGRPTGKDYQLTGAVDLAIRFTGYNVGTAWFREAYRKIGGGLKEWKANGFNLPRAEDLAPAKLFHQAVQGIKDGSVWAVRTAVRAIIIMIPSSIVFAAGRAPQSKFMGMAINPKKGALAFRTRGNEQRPGEWNFQFANQSYHNFDSGQSDLDRRLFQPDSETYFVGDVAAGPGSLQNPQVIGNGSPFKTMPNVAYQPFDQGRLPQNADNAWLKTTDKIGSVFWDTGNYLQKAGDRFLPKAIDSFGNTKIGGVLGLKGGGNDIMRKWVNAGIYAPYFGVKTDIMGNLYDNQQMNVSIDMAIDGLTKGNLHEFKAGVGNTVRTLLRKPLTDPKALEELGSRFERNAEDSSPTARDYAKSFVERVERPAQKDETRQDGWANIAKVESYAAQARADKLAREIAPPPGARIH